MSLEESRIKSEEEVEFFFLRDHVELYGEGNHLSNAYGESDFKVSEERDNNINERFDHLT